jgi:hypothetical protein
VLGDLEAHPIRYPVDRPLEVGVLEGDDTPAAAADRVMVVMAAGLDPLIARGSALDLEASDQPELLELIEGPVDGGTSDWGLVAPQLLVDLQGGHRAVLARQRLDDGAPSAALAVAGLGQRRHRVLDPIRVALGHRFDPSRRHHGIPRTLERLVRNRATNAESA